MKITRSSDGWIVHVPDQVVDSLDLADGQCVTIRAVVKPENVIRHAIAEMRGNLPDYPFDHMDWNGADGDVQTPR